MAVRQLFNILARTLNAMSLKDMEAERRARVHNLNMENTVSIAPTEGRETRGMRGEKGKDEMG